jgi:putative peptide zinc metalloprotease protein
MVELGWFVVRPFVNELQVWWRRRHDLRWGFRTWRTLFFLCVIVLFLPCHGSGAFLRQR